jgi:hypothetical protein
LFWPPSFFNLYRALCLMRLNILEGSDYSGLLLSSFPTARLVQLNILEGMASGKIGKGHGEVLHRGSTEKMNLSTRLDCFSKSSHQTLKVKNEALRALTTRSRHQGLSIHWDLPTSTIMGGSDIEHTRYVHVNGTLGRSVPVKIWYTVESFLYHL